MSILHLNIKRNLFVDSWQRKNVENHSIISRLNIFSKATPSFLQSPASILAGILENHIRDFNYERGEMKNRHSEKYQCLCVKFVGNFLTSLIKTKTLTYHM